MNKRIVMAANTVWYLANFRLNLARALQLAGYEVIAIAPAGEDEKRLRQAGVRYHALAMQNKGVNPFADLLLLWRLWRLLGRIRPMLYLGYTVKPNIYGGMACRLRGIASVHNIAGLGMAFMTDSWLTRLVRLLYRIGLGGARKVLFQNPDDLQLFLRAALVRPQQADRVPGSGVDTTWFAPWPAAPAPQGRQIRFLLSARLLWDKGVGEYVQAARQLAAQGEDCVCQIVGFTAVDNRSAIPTETLEAWQREGIIDYLGSTADVRPILAQADCVVLPSYYREGVPRALLEAASMAKPIITTDSVGCRETVDDTETGLLCRPRDAAHLAQKMQEMMHMPPEERSRMGRMGREKMLREFDERIVIDKYLELAETLGKGS